MSADGTQYDLLSQFQDRLREKVPFTTPQCFLCDDVLPIIVPPADPICTITVGGSQFDGELFDGGGLSQLTEHCPVLVTVLVRSTLDHPPAIETALLDPNRGLLMRYKPRILRALLADCDAATSAQGPVIPWSPEYDGEPILRDYVKPISCSPPTYMQQGQGGVRFLGITLTFRCSFDWRF